MLRWTHLEKAVCQSRPAALNHDVPNMNLHVPAEDVDAYGPSPCIGDCLLKQGRCEPHGPALEQGPSEARKRLQKHVVEPIHACLHKSAVQLSTAAATQAWTVKT